MGIDYRAGSEFATFRGEYTVKVQFQNNDSVMLYGKAYKGLFLPPWIDIGYLSRLGSRLELSFAHQDAAASYPSYPPFCCHRWPVWSHRD